MGLPQFLVDLLLAYSGSPQSIVEVKETDTGNDANLELTNVHGLGYVIVSACVHCLDQVHGRVSLTDHDHVYVPLIPVEVFLDFLGNLYSVLSRHHPIQEDHAEIGVG